MWHLQMSMVGIKGRQLRADGDPQIAMHRVGAEPQDRVVIQTEEVEAYLNLIMQAQILEKEFKSNRSWRCMAEIVMKVILITLNKT